MDRRIACTFVIASLTCAFSTRLVAQPSQQHHVILLLDRSESVVNTVASKDLELALRDSLRALCHTFRLLEDSTRALLDPSRGDLLSTLTFGLDSTSTSFTDFISPWPGTPGTPRANVDNAAFDTLWSRIHNEGFRAFFTAQWSGISLALPLALAELGRSQWAGEPVHRTFVVLITDGAFNGGDPTFELIDFRAGLRKREYPWWTAQGLGIARVETLKDEMRKYYGFDPVGGDHSQGNLHIRVFEAIPNTWAFGIESLWEFEHTTFRFRRVPEGYRSEVPLRLLPTDYLRSYRTEAALLDGDGRVLRDTVFTASDTDPVVRFFLPHNANLRMNPKVRMRFWVQYTDSIYGMQLLSPDGSELQGRRGLVREIQVALEPPERVLGMLPLPFWAFRVASFLGLRSQVAATWLWNLIALLIGSVVLAYSIWRMSAVRDASKVVVD